MKIRNLLAAGFWGLIQLTVWAQQVGPPPPRHAGSAPPLAATMQFLQKELNQVGKLDFVVQVRDKEEGKATVKYSEEVSHVLADPASCTIKYHYKRSMRGDLIDDEDLSVSLKDVLGISMMTGQQHDNVVFEREKAYPSEERVRFEQFEPTLFMVVMRKAGDNEEGFSFADGKKANRVFKAMAQAVSLCGGKSGPF